MSYMRPTIIICLFSTLVWLQFASTAARSISDISDFDNGNYNKILDNPIPAGYYYIKDGRITPVSYNTRRIYDSNSVYSQPNVRVKHQKTKKKLFVPNLFG